MYGYCDDSFVFLLTPCLGGLSVTIWEGERCDQVKELGVYRNEREALVAACDWCDRRVAAVVGNGRF